MQLVLHETKTTIVITIPQTPNTFLTARALSCNHYQISSPREFIKFQLQISIHKNPINSANNTKNSFRPCKYFQCVRLQLQNETNVETKKLISKNWTFVRSYQFGKEKTKMCRLQRSENEEKKRKFVIVVDNRCKRGLGWLRGCLRELEAGWI
jgi:hypothetical protein